MIKDKIKKNIPPVIRAMFIVSKNKRILRRFNHYEYDLSNLRALSEKEVKPIFRNAINEAR